jgi:dihydropteroate synthase
VVVGVLNVTPDSFSDGGRFSEPDLAIEHGLRMWAEGAGIVDVGGESTRPGAAPVDIETESARVVPVVRALADAGVAVSIDTRHAEVAAAAVEAGAVIINDVSGLRSEAMRRVAAGAGVAVVIMHSPVDDPATMQRHAVYDDVVHDVLTFLRAQAERALDEGIVGVIVDPGIGFGKGTEHNLEIVRRLDEIVALGYPVLVGASRKRFIGEITGVEAADQRIAGTLAVHLAALDRGARILRAHDVAEHVQAVRMWERLRA